MSTAFSAFWVAYSGVGAGKDTQLIPLEEFGWCTYAQRLRRYALFEAYHTSTVYTSLFREAAARGIGKYQFLRSIYSPVARQNDLLRAYVYGGAVDMSDLSGGVVPIVTDHEALIEPLKLLFTWSRLPELLPLWVGAGTKLGDAPIKVIDDVGRQKVRFELLDPRKVRDVQFDAVGNVKAIFIEYERDEEADLGAFQPGKVHPLEATPRSYLYTEIIDHDPDDTAIIRFRTYKDGKPFAFNTDGEGNALAEWTEKYGFIPVVWGGHKPTTLGFYDNAFSQSIGKIDEINDAASLLNDQIRKTVNVIWAYTGVKIPADVGFGQTARDQTPYVTLPVGGDAKPLVAPLPIEAALGNIKEMLLELERDMPELALQRVREQGSMTAPGIRAGYSDAIGRIQLARSSYNAALVRALQMGLTIGGLRGYDGFSGITLDSYAQGDLDFHIEERSVIADELTKQDRITALGSIGNASPPLQRLMLEEMGFSDPEIDKVVQGAEAEQEKAGNQINQQDANNVESLLQRLNTEPDASTQTPPELQGVSENGVVT